MVKFVIGLVGLLYLVAMAVRWIRGLTADGAGEGAESVVAMEKRHAKALGLDGEVNLEEIKGAYRRRMAEYHPDKVRHMGEDLQELAETKTREIREAYEYFRKKYEIA